MYALVRELNGKRMFLTHAGNQLMMQFSSINAAQLLAKKLNDHLLPSFANWHVIQIDY